jgi:hypothetical protein
MNVDEVLIGLHSKLNQFLLTAERPVLLLRAVWIHYTIIFDFTSCRHSDWNLFGQSNRRSLKKPLTPVEVMARAHQCKLRRDSISHLPKIFPSAPWHEKLKRHLNKLILVSINHPEVYKYLKSNAAVERESRRQVKHFPGFIIHPLSEFRKYWNIFMSLIMILHQLTIPFAIGFFIDMEDVPQIVDILIWMDITACSMLFLEILITLRTGWIVRETNEIVLKSKLVARKYLKYFLPDLVSCIPFVLLGTQFIEDQNGTVNGTTIIYMCCLFGLSFYRFSRILFYSSSIPIMLKLSEKGTIIFTLCLRSIYWCVFFHIFNSHRR